MKRLIAILAGSAFVASLSLTAFGGDDRTHKMHEERKHHDSHEHARGGDPLIDEMMKLDAVFRDVVSAVSLGDGHRVHEALVKMHGTMEKTHEGVHHGTVTLKKNADRLKDFVEQDKQFHARLEQLARAAHKNDQAAMATLTKELLDRCIACHRDFRQQ